MRRQKKNKTLQLEEKKTEVVMSEEMVLDSIQTEIDLARSELEKTKMEIEEKKKELESLPMRKLSAEEQKIQDKQIANITEKKAGNEVIEKQKAFDSVKVTGRFHNLRNKGQTVKLTYMKYQDDPVKWYSMECGKIYTIPRGFADQINDYYHTPVFTQKQGPMNPDMPESQVQEVDKSNKKYAFVPIAFA